MNSEREWRKYCKSGNKPEDISYNPASVYKKERKGTGDWLGTGTIAPGNKIFRPFKEARAFVHTLGLTRWEDWITYCRSGNRPLDIPVNPENTYKADWRGWPDILDDMTEGERYHVLLHKGIPHLQGNAAMLLKASIKGLNQEQKRQLKEFVHSDSEEIPDLGLGLEVNHTISSEEDEEEIKTKID